MTYVSRKKALVVALLASLVGVSSYVFGVFSTYGQQAEASILDASDFTFTPPAPLSLVSVPVLVLAMVVIAVIAWWFHGFRRGLWFLLFGGVMISTSQLLKERLLVRPELFEFGAPNTFPSGHMTVFAIVAGGLMWAFPSVARGALGLVAALLMSVVAWQLLEYGWHRPSDVLGALALGVLAFALAATTRLPGRGRTVRAEPTAARVFTRIIGVVLAVAGSALVVGGVILVIVAAQIRADALMLSASEISIVGASVLAARAMMSVST